jgi:hypothetical protein
MKGEFRRRDKGTIGCKECRRRELTDLSSEKYGLTSSSSRSYLLFLTYRRPSINRVVRAG